MRESTAPVIHRGDYTAPAFWIKTVELTFDLDAARTLVTSRMQLERNPDVPEQALRLHGDDLTVLRVLVNGESVSFRHDGGLLVLDGKLTAGALVGFLLYTITIAASIG